MADIFLTKEGYAEKQKYLDYLKTTRRQEVVEKLLPVAMQFDDNGVMEAWLFSNDCDRIPDISLDNYYIYLYRTTTFWQYQNSVVL